MNEDRDPNRINCSCLGCLLLIAGWLVFGLIFWVALHLLRAFGWGI